jgi:class 3 adenylate cyclase
MGIRKAEFDPDLETEYLASRASGQYVLARWYMGFGALLFLVLGAWDEMIDPGSLGSTWPFRLATAAAFLILLASTWTATSVRTYEVSVTAAFGIATIGFGLIVGEIDGGYIAGVGGFLVAISIVALSLSRRDAHASLAVLVSAPILVYALRGATGVEVANLALWLLSSAGFGYIAFLHTDATHRRAFIAERALEAERDKVDALIRKMVPEPIADRLKDGERDISDRFEDVTVLFADIVGFTRFSEAHDPEMIVGLLNSLFSDFDALVVSHGLEKIKTLGDGYMVAGGAPLQQSGHATRAARLALDMRSNVAVFSKENQVDWRLRIGIHSGPLVAGVIGTERYAYDLWGDTVNVASRLESTGAKGEIHISSETATRLDAEFELEALGPVAMKNREPVDAFRLVRAAT